MRSAPPPPFPRDPVWRFSHYSGLFFDGFATDSAWVRDRALLQFPPSPDLRSLVLRGEIRTHPDARGIETAAPTLECRVDGVSAGKLSGLPLGPFEWPITVPAEAARKGARIDLRLGGVALTNLLAWLGRVTGLASLQRFRAQNKNRQLRIASIATAEGETIFDFSNRHAPYSLSFARRHTQLGLNVVGFLTADLGVGESARCMVRAAEAADLPVALVPLRLHCNNRLGDQTYATRLQAENPHAVNVFHIDAPAARDIDHHHGRTFRAGKYNIAYFAWELPEFPDPWMASFGYFHEVWCPSEFVRRAIAIKSPLPVLTMPHAIAFARPEGNFRARFGLPADTFLFLFLYDLNSYSERKNPAAVLAAFRASGLAGRGAALVIKVHNHASHPADFAALRAAVADLPGTVLISETLSRAEIYQLESACDCFVSLHRSEGFGLGVAECMYLGKPVIATDWSATAEFLDEGNGCPVRCRLITLDRSHGPYSKGQTWADPDVAHAASWMQRLFDDVALRTRLGAAARATVEQRFSPTVIGTRYRRRLESIASW